MTDINSANLTYLIVGIFIGVIGYTLGIYLIKYKYVDRFAHTELELTKFEKSLESVNKNLMEKVANIELDLNKMRESQQDKSANLPTTQYGKQERLLQLAIERRILRFEAANIEKLLSENSSIEGLEARRHYADIYDILVRFGDMSQQLIHLFFTEPSQYQTYYDTVSAINLQMEKELMERTVSIVRYTYLTKGDEVSEDVHISRAAEILFELVRIPLMSPTTFIEAKRKITGVLRGRYQE